MTLLIDLLSGVVVGAMFLLTWIHYPYLPEKVPIHFGFNGRPDSWGPRWSIWLLPVLGVVLWGFLAGVGAAVPAGGQQMWLSLLRLEMLAVFGVITREQLRVAVGIQDRLTWAVWVLLLVVIGTAFFTPRG